MRNLPLFEQNLRDTSGAGGNLWMTSARLVDSGNTMPSEIARNDEQLLAIARKHAPDPSIFEQHPPVFLPIRASNNQMDAYFTRMAPSSLKNYAKEAAAGVSFLDSHVSSRLGLGYTLTGDYVEEGTELASVYVNSFVVPGIEETDKFLHRYRSGSVRDVSIGFYGGTMRCSICNENMFGSPWRCPHWPGAEYEIEDRNERGEVTATRTERAFAWVEDAHLSELSAVYDGATPDAVILKAERQIAEGRMSPQVVRMLNQRYRSLNLGANGARIFVPADLEEKTMSQERTQPVPSPAPAPTQGAAPTGDQAAVAASERAALIADITGILTEAGIPEAERADAVAGVRALATRFKSESAMAEIGRKYRTNLIDEAIKEGVRAHGNTFNAEGRRSLLEKLEVADIEQMRDEWRTIGDSVFPRGRQSQDNTEKPETRQVLAVPVGAFQS